MPRSYWSALRLLILILLTQASVAGTVAQAQTQPARPRAEVFPTDPFALSVLGSLEFVDYPDVLLALSVNNNRPWERYDRDEFARGKRSTLLSRWVRATTEPLAGNFETQLLSIHHIFDENPNSNFRDLPIDDAGGDIGRDPRVESFVPRQGFPRTQPQQQLLASLRANPGFFDQVTAEQLRVLKSNPLLKVESHAVADVMAALGREVLDPSGTPITQTAFLVRYQYPNAKRWRDFSNLLSPALQQQLTAAETAGLLNYNLFNANAPFNAANPAAGGVSPNFRALNRLVLRELLIKRFDAADAGQNFFKNYQRLIAVHPFQDYNGRSLRALYRRAVGRPLFILNFNHDLYSSHEEFGADVHFGDTGFDLIARGMVREQNAHVRRAQANPRDMAKFFDLPEWWIFAAGSEDGPMLSRLVAFSQTPAGAQPFGTRLIMESKRWISQIPIAQRIDKKLFDQLFLDYRANLREAKLLPQDPLRPLLRLPNPHVPASEIRPARAL